MLDVNQPIYVPILLPNDRPALAAAGRQQATLLSAVYGTNPRLADLCVVARQQSGTLLVDPKTPYFQFEGYMSMPDYRALRYSPGRRTLGAVWTPDNFAHSTRRRRLVDDVFGVQEQMGADLLLAPYFYVRHAEHPWLRVARACAEQSLEADTRRTVGVPVCVDIDAILDARHRSTIAAAFTGLAAAFYWLTVVNYDERLADPRDVAAVMALVDALVATGRPVVLSHVGCTGLLAIAHGAAGYAAGTHGLEAHPRRFFREMMGSVLANTYYLDECKVRCPVRTAEALLRSGIRWRDYPCSCTACAGSVGVSSMVSRRLTIHALSRRRAEVESLSAVPLEERESALRDHLSVALALCNEAASELQRSGSEERLGRGDFHYLEVLLEAAGGPPATIPGADEPASP